MHSSCTITESTDSTSTTASAHSTLTWEDYFELTTGGLGKRYRYKDTSVTELPDDLPQPPSDYPVSFSGCHHLVNIDTLAKWDMSEATDTSGMFNHCRSLPDISPLRPWDMSNVTDMSYMFNCCYDLSDVSAVKSWNIPKVTRMRYIFNGCHELPDFARLEVYDQQTFECFVKRYLWEPFVEYRATYGTDDDNIEIEEEEEVKEEWDEETMGPYPFPEADGDICSELTRTMDQPNGILDDLSDDCDLTKTTVFVPKVECHIPVPSKDSPMDDSSNNDLTMTLTPEMLRKYLISSSDEDEPY